MQIGIIGNIASGKSTMTKAFEKFGYKAFYESVDDNPFLELFYKDPSRYGLTMQIHMLHYRFKQVMAMTHSYENSITDSSIYSDTCFATMLYKDGVITKDEYGLYLNAFHNMKKFIVYPDAFIYIKTSPEQTYNRMKERARGCEVGVSLEYLTKLNVEFEALIDGLRRHAPVIVMDPFVSYEELDASVPTIIELIENERSALGTNRTDKLANDIYNWKL